MTTDQYNHLLSMMLEYWAITIIFIAACFVVTIAIITAHGSGKK